MAEWERSLYERQETMAYLDNHAKEQSKEDSDHDYQDFKEQMSQDPQAAVENLAETEFEGEREKAVNFILKRAHLDEISFDPEISTLPDGYDLEVSDPGETGVRLLDFPFKLQQSGL